MCRLFGLSGAPRRTKATFWLVEAPDSLREQSRRDPDGTGIGGYDAAGHPVLFRWPIAAYRDRAFARRARTLESVTYVAHVRYATTGALAARNTHPFEQAGRLFAHNGVVGGLPDLEAELGTDRALVAGETDSERFFALITRRIAAHGGAVEAGLVAGADWAARNLPIFSLNLVLITATDLWALRYPDTNELYVLERSGAGPTDRAAPSGGVRLRSPDLADRPTVIVASEPMDGEDGWRPMRSGELLHIDGSLAVTSRIALPEPPAHQLTLADLAPDASAAQAAV